MQCPNCGESVNDQPGFCEACGHYLPQTSLREALEEGASPPADPKPSTEGRTRRRWPWALGAVVLAAGAIAVTVILVAGEEPAAAPAQTTTDATTPTETTAAPTTEATSVTTAETTTTEAALGFPADVGVTAEPCPGSPNPDNGCIYLGIISDLSDGLFAALAIPLTEAEQDFWTVVNEAGGLDGFDVAITAETTVDAHSDPQRHVAGFVEIEPTIAMLAQSLGTPQTRAALAHYDAADVVAVPASWWSGWSFPDHDMGLILETGASYCVESMNAFDFVVQRREEADFTYAIVAFPGDDGGDYSTGVKIAAEANGLGGPVVEILQTPISAGGDVSETVATLVSAKPDVVFLAVAAGEMAQIVAGTHQGGHQAATYIGVGPSWNALLLGHEALIPLLEDVFFSSPWGGWSTASTGHALMREAAGRFGREPSVGYTAGWVLQYNVKAALESAIAGGDLTRAGIRAAAAQLEEVDYQGMLPTRSFVGSPREIIVRQSLVNRIDPDEPDGLAPATSLFAGPTASSLTFEAPCFAG